ncbi:type II toxin-antitoxin system Phd/YefM family antitoxin [Candidatus Parcubacteria bacterium]|nr:type II toxin-antitoxin system Phd/YefM family antitoxin [Candidatus Parcubacteria bacterium]
MPNLINITQARNNLSQLIDEVSNRKKTYVLLRDSVPQAAIVPYEEYKLQEERWQEEAEKLMAKGEKSFKQWLKKRKMAVPRGEDEVYQIVDQVADRR